MFTPDVDAETRGRGDCGVSWCEWARYAAQDANGKWHVYEALPGMSVVSPMSWNNYVEPLHNLLPGGTRYAHVGTTEPNPDWKNTLINLRD